MKKLIFYLPLCALIAVVLFQCSNFLIDIVRNYENPVYEQEQYFRKINEIIKDLEFHSAKAKDEKIILYNNNYEPISEIPFEDFDKSIKFISAHKNNNIVYFITGGAVDDEWGIMFVNDGVSDRMMDGVGSATKIGGNSYEYTSMYKYMK